MTYNLERGINWKTVLMEMMKLVDKNITTAINIGLAKKFVQF